MTLASILAYGMVGMTGLGFLLTVLDRILAASTKKTVRISENLLLGIAFLLGGIGVMLGFFLAKRGLYKPETRLGVPAVALGETILLFWMVPGFWEAVKAVFGG